MQDVGCGEEHEKLSMSVESEQTRAELASASVYSFCAFLGEFFFWLYSRPSRGPFELVFSSWSVPAAASILN